MPILSVQIGAHRSPALTNAIKDLLLDLTQRILHKSPAVTAIALQYVDPQDWFIAGRSLADWGQSSIYFDIKITDETNSKAEKAAYIAAAFAGLGEILGDLHEESYIYVQDVRATAYGYGGKTQEHRYQHPAA